MKDHEKFYTKYYKQKRWKRLRYNMWIQQDKRCQRCRTMIFDFHLHHIKPVPWEYDPDYYFWDKDNLEVLCRECHSQHTWEETHRKEYHPPKRPARK